MSRDRVRWGDGCATLRLHLFAFRRLHCHHVTAGPKGRSGRRTILSSPYSIQGWGERSPG
eukprot:6003555-Prymnesium_polylepis.1